MSETAEVTGYEELSVNAMLCGALLAMDRVVAALGLGSDESSGLLDHLWQWFAVGPETFTEWYKFDNPILSYALGDQANPLVLEIVERSEIAEATFRALWGSLVEILEGNLFTQVRLERTHRHLARFASAARTAASVRLPSPQLVRGNPLSDARVRHGWGATIQIQQVADLRQTTW